MTTNLTVLAVISWISASILSEAVPELSSYNAFVQYGALGILAYVVWASETDRRRMSNIMQENNRLFLEEYKKAVVSNAELKDAAEKMNKAVQNCILKQGNL